MNQKIKIVDLKKKKIWCMNSPVIICQITMILSLIVGLLLNSLNKPIFTIAFLIICATHMIFCMKKQNRLDALVDSADPITIIRKLKQYNLLKSNMHLFIFISDHNRYLLTDGSNYDIQFVLDKFKDLNINMEKLYRFCDEYALIIKKETDAQLLNLILVENINKNYKNLVTVQYLRTNDILRLEEKTTGFYECR